MSPADSFTLIREAQIPEINTLARLYRHDRSGAEVLSLINEDENKSFGISFRTIPQDSTGVAHILEHAVLNGSKKYPVKEPFVELIKGSLNTFLNAMTFPDKTVYPVASTNLKDFYNLVDVYLDAVFHPLIPEHILEQEGWHYDIQDPEQPLTFKGVVFNEMKGAYGSPENRLGNHVQQTIFPDTIYAHDAGGDPVEIPNLTYEQFKNFHETFYHPSNALIYFYGDDDPEERLRYLDGYLRDFEARPMDAVVPIQSPFEESRRYTFKYPADPNDELEKKSMVAVNWLLPEPEDLETAFAGDILSHILLGNQAAPLRKALIDSGFGENLVGGGLDDYTRQPTFSVGLKGIRSENAGEVEDLILETLKQLSSAGIDRESVEASLNTFEFRLRESNTGSFPRGLWLMILALGEWTYGRDPIGALYFEAPLQSIRERFDSGERLFESLIDRYLLDNPHRTTVLLEPDTEMQAREEAAERARLEAFKAGQTIEEIEALVERTRTLQRIQSTPDSPEDLARLPFLKLEDLEKENQHIPIEVSAMQAVPLVYHDLFTNGIAYFDLAFDLHTLPEELLPYVPVFTRALLGVGTETQDFVQLTRRIGRKIGGLYATSFVSPKYGQSGSVAKLVFRGKGTMAQTGDLVDILRDVVLTIQLDDRERFRQMVNEIKASKEASLVPSGHSYALTRLRAGFHEAYWLNEQFGGLTSLFFFRQLVEEIEQDWPAMLEKLERIRQLLFCRQNALVNVTLDAKNWANFRPQVQDFLQSLPDRPADLRTWTPGASPADEGFTLPAQVNYVSKGARLTDGGYRPHGSALVVNKYLLTTYLWEKIRVQGGAYGSMAAWDRLTGFYGFVSYRDPNLIETLEKYDGAADFLKQLSINRDELTKTIIGTIGDIDGYQLPDAKGFTSLTRFMAGVSDENRQQLRDEIMATGPEDFGKFGQALERIRHQGNVAILGSTDALREANQARGGEWLDIQKAM